MVHHTINGKAKPIGEKWVWVTSMGLAVGLLMVITLLGLIVRNGLAVFWPKPVSRIELTEDSRFAMRGTNVLGGMIAGSRTKIVQSAEGGDREWHLMVGNKDVYGATFRYIDHAAAKNISFPPRAIMVERMEYGFAIGLPAAIHMADGTVIAANDSTFDRDLKALINEATTRRKEIHRIERKDIGVINHELQQLRIKERRLSSMPDGETDAARAAIGARRAELQKQYETLVTRAAAMRAEQNAHRLELELFTGESRQLPIGAMVHAHYPNAMGFGDKLAHFGRGLWAFVSQEPREANMEGGIFPAIFGTFVMTLLMSIAVTPFGVLAAIYLREYATQGLFVRMVRISVNNLAGVPSIVFGVFGLGFFVYFVGGSIDNLFFSETLPTPTFGTGGILWASLTLALMTVPVVIVATEESLAAVPRGVREGSLALGASKWQTIARCVLPASAPGILTGLVLAMARGAGEVAPLMLVGVVKLAPSLPIDHIYPFIHLDQKFMHLGFHIFDLGFQSPDSDAAQPMVFATTLFLILLVVLLNLGAIIVRERLRRKYATGAF
ncbi:MAG TPA: phosphate ABC transporter permease PstA [Kiritimatiellia bacterium]|nr:phosphate ABC transporter permease PstA [Kiritimatiellia bacterium]HMO97673.1 phosphate ABC transporter permease PstA [Kiritimatiellia bacterium]HMP95534.1 phosphate ABC transporter permease PstA [Kiritimatiellia bacterium]